MWGLPQIGTRLPDLDVSRRVFVQRSVGRRLLLYQFAYAGSTPAQSPNGKAANKECPQGHRHRCFSLLFWMT
jgi:hypothetical protein